MKCMAGRLCAFGLAVEQEGITEMLVPFRPRPHRWQGYEVGEIERRNGRLADIGIDMAGEAPKPGLDPVHALDGAGEVAALDDLLGEPQLFGRDGGILVPDGERRGHIDRKSVV